MQRFLKSKLRAATYTETSNVRSEWLLYPTIQRCIAGYCSCICECSDKDTSTFTKHFLRILVREFADGCTIIKTIHYFSAHFSAEYWSRLSSTCIIHPAGVSLVE